MCKSTFSIEFCDSSSIALMSAGGLHLVHRPLRAPSYPPSVGVSFPFLYPDIYAAFEVSVLPVTHASLRKA